MGIYIYIYLAVCVWNINVLPTLGRKGSERICSVSTSLPAHSKHRSIRPLNSNSPARRSLAFSLQHRLTLLDLRYTAFNVPNLARWTIITTTGELIVNIRPFHSRSLTRADIRIHISINVQCHAPTLWCWKPECKYVLILCSAYETCEGWSRCADEVVSVT